MLTYLETQGQHRAVAVTHSEVTVTATHSEVTVTATHSEIAVTATHSEVSVATTHSEIAVEATHSEVTVTTTHSEVTVGTTYSEQHQPQKTIMIISSSKMVCNMYYLIVHKHLHLWQNAKTCLLEWVLQERHLLLQR